MSVGQFLHSSILRKTGRYRNAHIISNAFFRETPKSQEAIRFNWFNMKLNFIDDQNRSQPTLNQSSDSPKVWYPYLDQNATVYLGW